MVKVREDLINKVFGRLTVVRQDEDDYVSSSGLHYAKWICKCSCGKEETISVRGDRLTQGYTTSCGCLKNERVKQMGKNNKKENANKIDTSGEYGLLWLTNTNNVCYFDLEDTEIIRQYTWFEDNNGYPTACIDGKQVKMHQLICGKWHDHSDRNKLNNRKSNLRSCTRQQNTCNISLRKNNTSGIIGVSWDKESSKWTVQINVNQKRKKVGRFVNKDDAIKARLQAEAMYYGEFAPQRHLFEQYGIHA